MLDRSDEELDLTHLGWRTLPAGAGGGDDRLLLVDEHRLDQANTGSEPLVQFLDPHQDGAENPSAPEDSEPLHFLEVQDETFEAPPFLWGGEDTIDADEAEAAVVIFGEGSTDTAKTVFS